MSGGEKKPSSYLARMAKIKAYSEQQAARYAPLSSTQPPSTRPASDAEKVPAKSRALPNQQEKENVAEQGMKKHDAVLNGIHPSSSFLGNVSAQHGTSLGAGSSFSSLGETQLSDDSKHDSHASSVIDIPRASNDGQRNGSLLSHPRDVSVLCGESFSRPKTPEQRRGLSERPRPAPIPSATSPMPSTVQRVPVAPSPFPPAPTPRQRPPCHLQPPTEKGDALRRNVAPSHNGSFMRSKSFTREPMATPAGRSFGNQTPFGRGGGDGVHATPMQQTPSILRSSFSESNLAMRQIIVHGREYGVIGKEIGKGGSSSVYQAYDAEFARNVAIKIVDLSRADETSRAAFINEIHLLESLQGSRHVIKMFDYELCEEEEKLYVVMEKGDTDLGHYLKTRSKEISPNYLRFWWEEMLHAVKVIHDRKVLHSDLKPANFLLVSGNLKLIDFGIASSIPSNKTSVVKDSKMGTLSYMPPEALSEVEEHEDFDDVSKFKMTARSDVWSLGCIFYKMVTGVTPFEGQRNSLARMKAICDPNAAIDYKDVADKQIISVLERCLVRDVKQRATVDELLAHPYLTSNPSSEFAVPTESPLSDDAIAQFAVKMKSFTPRTASRKLKELLTVARRNGVEDNTPRPMLTFDSPPSTH